MSKLQVANEFWELIKYNKKYWLLPIVLTLVLVGALLVAANGSALSPFVYALF
jgi:hypothetical protein